MIGLGTQDNYSYAQEFISDPALGEEITFLWDESFATWEFFQVRANSQMAILDAGLTGSSSLFYGFGASEQAEVLRVLPEFS